VNPKNKELQDMLTNKNIESSQKPAEKPSTSQETVFPEKNNDAEDMLTNKDTQSSQKPVENSSASEETLFTDQNSQESEEMLSEIKVVFMMRDDFEEIDRSRVHRLLRRLFGLTVVKRDFSLVAGYPTMTYLLDSSGMIERFLFRLRRRRDNIVRFANIEGLQIILSENHPPTELLHNHRGIWISIDYVLGYTELRDFVHRTSASIEEEWFFLPFSSDSQMVEPHRNMFEPRRW